VITIAMSAVIGATRARVWRALTVPEEVIRWDERLLSLEAPAPRHPRVGESVRWRCRLGAVAVDLLERPIEVVPCKRLVSEISLGLFRFEETCGLADEAGDASRTRLSLRLVASNSVPLVGGLLDRFEVRELATTMVDAKLKSLQRWCERGPRAGAGSSPSPPGAHSATV
jgi:uncharacterized protein YndB with AHSA1/START domain